MGKWVVKYEDWSKEDIKRLGDIVNELLTTLDQAYAGPEEEACWLRRWEEDMIKLINDVSKKNDT